MEGTHPADVPPPLIVVGAGGLSSAANIEKEPDGVGEAMQSPVTFRSLDSLESVEDYVRESLLGLEERLETVLDNMSEELAGEVSRERQHLLLMQEQVDKQSRSLQYEFSEIRRTIEQERTARVLVQQSARERNERMSENLATIARELGEVRSLVAKIAPQTPWVYRVFNNVMDLFRQCTADPYVRLPS